MQQIWIQKAGPPEVLRVQDGPDPIPRSGEVRTIFTDRDDACQVAGHHNLLFCGDFARRFRRFAQLYGMRLADTGYRGTWPL